MSHSRKVFFGYLDEISTRKILLHIEHLQDGSYILKIINNHTIIKEVFFKKTTIKNPAPEK